MKETKKSDRKNNSGELGKAAALGAAIGAVSGVGTAVAADKIRGGKDETEEVEEVKDTAGENVQEIKAESTHAVHHVSEKAARVSTKLSTNAEQEIHSGQDQPLMNQTQEPISQDNHVTTTGDNNRTVLGEEEIQSDEVIVNPDEIAQAIISGEEIDPNDIDKEAEYNFVGVERVATIDGTMETHAVAVDSHGNEVVLVDVDNDNMFDMQRNPSTGAQTAYYNPNASVDDAEHAVSDPHTYMAADNHHHDPEIDQTIHDDIITV